MKNLAALERASKSDADVHLITQLILSLLALVVFPKERDEFASAPYQIRLEKLEENGWPKWHHLVRGKVQTLADLLFHLRNAISHARVSFTAEDREYENVVIEFTNYYNDTVRWQGRMNAADLREFCNRLRELILDP